MPHTLSSLPSTISIVPVKTTVGKIFNVNGWVSLGESAQRTEAAVTRRFLRPSGRRQPLAVYWLP